MGRKTKPRIQWHKGDELNRWVTCLSCFHEYFIESFELNPCCPICESREYDETELVKDYLDYDELNDLL
jgi:hypothetical protein